MKTSLLLLPLLFARIDELGKGFIGGSPSFDVGAQVAKGVANGGNGLLLNKHRRQVGADAIKEKGKQSQALIEGGRLGASNDFRAGGPR